MRSTNFITSLLLFVASSSAWLSDLDAIDILPREIDVLLERQDAPSSSKFPTSYTGIEGNTATTLPPSSTPTGSQAQETGTGTATNTNSVSGSAQITGSGSGNQNQTSSPATQTFDARLPAGGLSMVTPNPFSTSYYKIGDYVTFAWNYTSLLATPSAVDILASCRVNSNTYTIAMNQSWSQTQAITWDTNEFQKTATVPLLTETYTLIIHDAAKDVSATPSSGYLATYEQFTFGMYVPQPYTPIANFVCATCNSAFTAAERQTMQALVIMVGMTVLSFSWFTGVAGIW